MISVLTRIFAATVLGASAVLLTTASASAQSANQQGPQDPLKPASDKVRQHLETIKKMEPDFEKEIKTELEQARQDSIKGQYQSDAGMVQ